MRSITVEALWGTDSKCLWCSRNIHVSGALQNPIGLAAFEERQMNNQKGVEGGIQHERSFGEEKKWKNEKAKQPLLCWVFEVLPPADTGTQRHTKAHRLSLSLSLSLPLPLFSLCLSLSPPSFISSTSLHLHPSVCSRDPPCPTVLTTRLLSRLWYVFAERSTAYFGSISPATAALITATKPGLFNCTDSHLFVIHSHYHFPKALKHMHAELTSWFL